MFLIKNTKVRLLPKTNPAITHSRGGALPIVVLSLVILAGICAGIYFGVRKSHGGSSGLFASRVKYPKELLLEDFQRPLDRDLTEHLIKFERTWVSDLFDKKVLKPFFDDVNTRQLIVEGVELRPEQLPDRQDLHRHVEDCAKILKIPKPRVFLKNSAAIYVYTANMVDPVIVLSSGFLEVFRDPAEMRFVIGHEMGHIKCRHVKLNAVLSAITESFRRLPVVPEEIALIPYLPLFKWAREAEMTADNAGLICAQDREAAERALVRLLIGLNQEATGRINVEAFLSQQDSEDSSKFSEVVIYLRQLLREHPFMADRIKQLRKYEVSRQYQHLWEK